MATGDLEGLPFSAAAVRDLVTSLPSMYDILPQWACIAPRDPAKDPTPVKQGLHKLHGNNRTCGAHNS